MFAVIHKLNYTMQFFTDAKRVELERLLLLLFSPVDLAFSMTFDCLSPHIADVFQQTEL